MVWQAAVAKVLSNCTTMANVFATRQPEDFTYVHQRISQRTTRTDQTLRYLKGWMQVLSLHAHESWDINYTAAHAKARPYRPRRTSTTMPRTSPSHNKLHAVLAEHHTPFYAREGCALEMILADALMSAAYPVYTVEWTWNGAGPVAPARRPIITSIGFPTHLHHGPGRPKLRHRANTAQPNTRSCTSPCASTGISPWSTSRAAFRSW
jgi:hypothetical protein